MYGSSYGHRAQLGATPSQQITGRRLTIAKAQPNQRGEGERRASTRTSSESRGNGSPCALETTPCRRRGGVEIKGRQVRVCRHDPQVNAYSALPFLDPSSPPSPPWFQKCGTCSIRSSTLQAHRCRHCSKKSAIKLRGNTASEPSSLEEFHIAGLLLQALLCHRRNCSEHFV